MTLNKLASAIAKIEGKKSQSRIGDIREILKIIQNMIKEEVIEFNDEAPILKLLISKAVKELEKQGAK